VCKTCILAMTPVSGETCNVCGEGLPGLRQTSEFQTCSACQDSRPLFAKATAYGAYRGELRELIHLLKYEGVLPARHVLGWMLAEAIAKLNISKLKIGEGPVLVVPVPLYSSKKRQRGFNQSELIARTALKNLGLKNEGKLNFQLLTDVLLRERDTVSQIGLTRPQRAENIRGAFRVPHPSRVAGHKVLLVDDVLTTGTTASECARVLRKAGAESVWVATVGRTLKENIAILQVKPQFENTAQVS
jgi:ComF family protein